MSDECPREGTEPERADEHGGPVDELYAPAHVVRAAKESFRARAPAGTQLAELAFDSVVDGRHEPAAPRVLRFTASGVAVELVVEPRPDGIRIAARLEPPAAAVVEVRRADGVFALESVGNGAFSVDGVPQGPLCLRLRFVGAGGATVQTDWVDV
jgi:hypothetical protein